MSDVKVLARPYAKAAYEFAKEHHVVDKWLSMLNELSVCAQDHNLSQMFDHPLYSQSQAANVIFEVLGKSLDEHAKNLVNLMAENIRLAVLPDLYAHFVELKSEDEKMKTALVTTIEPLSDSYIQLLTKKLSTKLGVKLAIETKIDKSIIGGLLIEVDDMVIDASVKGKLERLANQLSA